MAKKLRKSEKLDLILSEIAEIRAEIGKLLKHQSERARQGAGLAAKPAKKKEPPKRTRPKAVAKPAPAKPVLVEAPATDRPTEPASRSA
jgi:hypothetical protein